MMRRLAGITILWLATGAAGLAAQPQSPGLADARDRGWVEAVIQLRNPQPMLQFAREVAGWQVDRLAPAAGAAGPPEWRIGDASGQAGTLRVVQIDAPESRALRASAQPWDTGGHFSVMARSNDATGRWRAAERLGWSAWNAPVELEFGGVRLANVILRGPEGLNLSVYERLSPRVADAPDLRRLRRPFNAMQVVRDAAAARRFYVDVLEFEVLAEGQYRGAPGIVNNFGMPANLTGSVTLDYLILGPSKSGPTQIEIVRFAGIEGRALPAPGPRDLGLVALRFPVSDLSVIERRLRTAAWPDWQEPAIRDLPPYGRVRMLAVSSPEGAKLEFFETLSPTATEHR
jgi:catechol 2,3-dioxygenase-like lactoylglutathione lyase family enzyme